MNTRHEQAPLLASDEDIALELERVAEMIRERPELNHSAAERLLAIARTIRADVARAGYNLPSEKDGDS